MGRSSNTDTRRSQIITAMMTVMSEQGYDGATIQAVAANAGLTPGLVHYHFKSKLEILLHLIEMIEGQVRQRYLKRASVVDPMEDLEAFIHAHLGLGDDSNEELVKCWIVIGAEALRQTDVQQAYRSVTAKQLTILENIIKRCLKVAGKSTRASRPIALGIYSAIEGSFRLLVSAPTLIQVGFAEPTVLSMAAGAIASAKAQT